MITHTTENLFALWVIIKQLLGGCYGIKPNGYLGSIMEYHWTVAYGMLCDTTKCFLGYAMKYQQMVPKWPNGHLGNEMGYYQMVTQLGSYTW